MGDTASTRNIRMVLGGDIPIAAVEALQPALDTPRPPVMAAATIALGDSITTGQTTLGGGLTGVRTGYDPLAWAAIESGGRIFYQRNVGVDGNTSALVLARVQADVIARNPAWCVLMVGTNDIAAAVPLATYAANVAAIVAALTAAGIRTALCTIPPRGAGEGAALDYGIETFNSWIRGFAARSDVVLVDIYRATVDPATAGFLAIYNADDVHPSVSGAHQMGRTIAAAMLPHLGGYVPPLASHNVGASSKSLLPNGVFLGAGTPAGLAVGWTDYFLGVGNVTPTLRTEAGVLGNVQRLLVADTPASGGFTHVCNPALWDPGDVVQWSFRCAQNLPVDGGYWSLALIFETPGSVFRYPLPFPLNVDDTTYDQNFALAPCTREFLIPAGATSMTMFLNIAGEPANDGAWIDLAEMSLYNLTALGLTPVAT